eukprot:TRINITY_DN870_c1_g1_i1.p1 TRINITY_DN870_c1_g1~~TRINITY_DN870_c1_g1_i1.p1  ORF type:complete len:656 (+),score=106.09 TRINITY_DN870_c1_g1_i1:108-2075(+)
MQSARQNQRLAVIAGHLPHLPTFLGSVPSPLATQDACGIIAYIGDTEAKGYLLEGLKILEPRGYDSAGITTIDSKTSDRKLVTTKYASLETTSNAIAKLEQNSKVHERHTIGIAHTRWATHGGKTNENAHPHHDEANRIAIVHNGVLENAADLKKELKEKYKLVFRSETDSEIIAQLIGQFVKEGENLREAVNHTLDRLQGTWGIAVVDRENPDQIIAAKNGSPILIGIGENKMFVGSESSAFSKHTKEFIALEDGEVAVVTAQGHSLDRRRAEKVIKQESYSMSPAPWPFWTIREIMEQPAAISRALNYGGRLYDESTVKLGGLEANEEVLGEIEHLIIAACGTSYYAALEGALLMRTLNCFKTVQVIDAAEMGQDILPKQNGGLLVISQSGETKDVHRALTTAQSAGLPSLSIVNAVGSLVARSTACGVYLNAGREVAVASTKAFTCQVTVLSLIAIWFAQIKQTSELQKRRILVEALHRLPTNVGMALQGLRKTCQTLAAKLLANKVRHMFVLGKGYAYPIAMEGALKIKEISYIHAEGYSGGALKHGPYALITKGTPIILIALDDKHASKMLTVAEEVKAREAHLILITNKPSMFNEDLVQGADMITIPSNGMLTSVLATLPLQLLAYELSVGSGYDPDHPRNLAKSVTVD